jgi:hypothetical protein
VTGRLPPVARRRPRGDERRSANGPMPSSRPARSLTTARLSRVISGKRCDLVAQRVDGGTFGQERVERANVADKGVAGARQRRARRQHDAEVVAALEREPCRERHEVAGVLGDQRAAILDRGVQQRCVGQPHEAGPVADADGVVTARARSSSAMRGR